MNPERISETSILLRGRAPEGRAGSGHPAQDRNARISRGTIAALVGFLIVYTVCSLLLARVKVPWCDEGWFGNPAYNFAFRGNLGSNVQEPSGHYLNAYLRGIQQRIYYMVPLHLVTAAGWLKVTGFSAFTMRAYSVFWGVVALTALFVTCWRLTFDQSLSILTVAIASLDFVFQWAGADARMDMMACGLGLCSIAAYLLFQEQRLTLAIALSQCFAAASCFTHPNGIMAVLTLIAIMWRFDRHRVRLAHLLIAIVPYAVLGAAWLTFIMQSPADFVVQMRANAAGRSERIVPLTRPWLIVMRELGKYLTTYGLDPIWIGKITGWLVITPIMYLIALVGCVESKAIRNSSGTRDLLWISMLYLTGLTFVVGFKAQNYVTYSVPFFAILFAIGLQHLWRARHERLVTGAIMLGFVTLQMSALVQKVRLHEYQRLYEPVAMQLKEYRQRGLTIFASSVFGFELQYSGFIDDARLGRYTGVKADVVVLDPWFHLWMDRFFVKEEPEVHKYLTRLIQNEYRLISRNDIYEIYERR